jgi:hypothetical protein
MKGNKVELNTKLYQIDRNKREEGLVENRFNIFNCILITKLGKYYLYQFALNSFGTITTKSAQADYNNIINIFELDKQDRNKTFTEIIKKNKTKLGFYYSTLHSVFYFSETNQVEDSFAGFALNYKDLKEDVNKLLIGEIHALETKKKEIEEKLDNLIKQVKENGTQS